MKEYTILENDANQRLDRFLKKLFINASANLIYKFNRKGKIKVNSKKKDNEYKLQIGDEVKIFLCDEDFFILSQKKEKKKVENQNKLDKSIIVYEDRYLLILNKESGINVHPGDYKTKETNVIYQVHDYLGDKLDSLTFKPSLIHRIDRDTSGILMIGKKKDILTKLVSDFKTHNNIKKFYYAIVFGKLKEKSGIIDKKLFRVKGAKNEDKVQVRDDGQKAITKYKVLNELKIKIPLGEEFISEVELEILTGRMHQIRVHMANIGNPVLLDDKYGNKRFNAYLKKHFGLKRQALHAWKIEFFHYGREKNMKLTARIKEDLVEFLEKIKS